MFCSEGRHLFLPPHRKSSCLYRPTLSSPKGFINQAVHQSALPTECFFWSPHQTGTTIRLRLCHLLEASSLNAGWGKNYPREELLCTLLCCPLCGAVRLHAPKSSSSASPHSMLHGHHPNSTVLCSLFVDPCEKQRKSSSVPELPFPTAELLTSFPLLCADEQQLFHAKWKTRVL